ncbi:MAG: hypothetical protein ABI540_05260 [Spartobacteria bacterium]
MGQITITGEGGSQETIALKGSATAPVTIEPNELRFGSSSGEAAPRSASISLANQADYPLTLTFKSSRNIQPIEDVTLAPRETKRIPIVLENGGAALQEEIVVQGSDFRVRLPVSAEPLVPKPAEIAQAQQSPPVAPSSPAATAVVSPPSAQTAVRSQPAAPPSGAPPPKSLVDHSVSFRVQRVPAAGWELHWALPKVAPANYRVEERFLSLNAAGELQVTWHAVAQENISASGGSVVA